MGYKVFDIPLDNLIAAPAGALSLLVPQGVEIAEVSVNDVDPGSSFKLKFGLNGDAIGVRAPQAYELTGDEASGGLYIVNTVAQPGLVAHVLVSYADAKAPDGVVKPGTPGQVRGGKPGQVVW